MSLINNNLDYRPDYTYNKYEIVKQNNFRYYKIQNILVPSVTSILRLSRWNQIDYYSKSQAQSFDIGNHMHKYLYDYVLGLQNEVATNNNQVIAERLAKTIIDKFFPMLSNILAAEATVHNMFSYAGTLDLMATIDGNLTIVDYKSSSRKKSNFQIDEHFQQLSAYAEAHDIMHGTCIDQIMIVIIYKDNLDLEICSAAKSELKKYKQMWNDKLKYYQEVSIG